MSTRDDETTQRTLPYLLRNRAETMGDREFLKFRCSESITFWAMESATTQVAHGLARLGVRAGDRVTMILPNAPELVMTWFAAAKLGAIEVPVNIELKGPLLRHVVGNSGAKVVVCHRDHLQALAEILSEVPMIDTVVVVGGPPALARDAGVTGRIVIGFDELRHQPATPLDLTSRYSDPLAILYTSGTTGNAKGVVMSHNQYYTWVELYARHMSLTQEDSYFTPLPLFHGDAQLWGVYFPLVFGTRGTLEPRFSASKFWDQIRESGATATNLLGAMAHILWRRERSERDSDNPLRVAQALPMVPFRDEFEERFGLQLVTAYGQTETNWVAYDRPGDSKAGSCGRINTEYFDVRILDDLDRDCPRGVTGEIAVRSKQPWTMASGYHDLPDKTVDAWRNLWFHTGDSGYIDSEGRLYFVDRIKDAIRRRGQNISAQELESVLDQHPHIAESAAIAVPSDLSEDDVLVVVVEAKAAKLTPAAVLEFCRERLPRFMVPRYIEIRREPLPRTPTEKIAKGQLRAGSVTENTWDTTAERSASSGPEYEPALTPAPSVNKGEQVTR